MDFEEMKNAVKRAQEHESPEDDEWLEETVSWIR